MNFLPENIEQYIEAHTSVEPELLKNLCRETWQKIMMPRMLSGHVQGRFLSLISHLIQPKSILEIGTFTGYSALCLAEGLPPDGQLITIDINDELKWIHEKYIQPSPFHSHIHCMYGDALEVMKKIDIHANLVFIDADKENYINYFEFLIERLPSGALMMFDNALWSGKVTEEAPLNDHETRVLQELNIRLATDPRVSSVILPLRDGIMMTRIK